MLLLGIVTAAPAIAQTSWAPTPSHPYLDPDKIQVGKALHYSNGTTILVQKNEKVTLSAKAKDQDYFTVGSSGGTQDDATIVEWSKSGGSFNISPARANSIEWTAPNATGTFTVTATPDREDPPNSSAARSITFVVLDSCPADIGITSTCSLPTNWGNYWAAVFPGAKTGAVLHSTRMTVSGGAAPPTPPGNWNGLYIKEIVGLHPVNSGTAGAGDFNFGVTPGVVCTASVEGFVVGSSQGSITWPSVPAGGWDDHAGPTFSGALLVGGAGTSKTVICAQTYKCGNVTLHAGSNDRFKITYTFSNVNYTPPNPDVVVTQTSIQKQAD
jgi:hypothetical protein